MTYLVMVDDNFHYMDPEERHRSGEFAHAEDAIAHCRSIVDEYLTAALAAEGSAAMTAQRLWESYTTFGDDPFVVATAGEAPVRFSAWDYAREQCRTRCGDVPNGESIKDKDGARSSP